MNLIQKVIQITTANAAVRFFTVTTLISWGRIHPHFSNTGAIYVGGTSSAEGAAITTADDGFWLPRFLDAASIYINSSNVSNQAVLLYTTEA